ncbi:DUF935 family protein [Stenotrophomonas maltophilia]|uniref:DUF935 domain-containing protein n=1 Tax=Stenotrophomonas maltophilia TaxID=40324 RepID=UPI0018A6BB06|nr:DUF935 family protein [Stenotrophomonas maltophilia]MBN4937092.1 DUF935 family protein [Stenotrophomonas maltophilia]
MSQDLQRPQPGLEIATTLDGRDWTNPSPGALLVPGDSVLRTRSTNDLLIYEQVRSDWQVKACFEQRRNAVISREWRVDAASDRRVDRQAADWLRTQLQRVGWDRVTDRMLWGVFYGYSVAELVWSVQEGKLGWSAIKVRNRRRFSFAPGGELRLLTPQRMYDGEPAKAPYFWSFSTGADHDDEPFGIGLAHWLYWPTLFKRNDIALWMTFLDKFAAPTAVGKFESGASSAEKGKLLDALRAVRTDTGIAVPKGMEISLLEAARSGTADYKVLCDTMDDAIAKATLGQTMTTQNGSSRAQAEVHMDVRQDIVRADSDLVCESFNLGPVRWLTMFNFPNAEPPRVYRVLDEEEDLNTKADRDTKIIGMGFRPKLNYIHENYGDQWEERTPASPPAADEGADQPVTFTEVSGSVEQQRQVHQDRVDQLVTAASKLGMDWRTFIAPRVRELQVLLDEVDDLEAFRQRVIELADAPPNSDLAEALARCDFGAHLLGRAPKA